jgi:hypothetical protein
MASDMEMPYKLTFTEQQIIFNRFTKNIEGLYSLVCKKATMSPIVHECILDYIENRLLTNFEISGYLRECDLYKDLVEAQIAKYSEGLATKFMDYCLVYPGGTFETHAKTTFESVELVFDFKFKGRIGQYYHGSTKPFNEKIRNIGKSGDVATRFWKNTIFSFDKTHEAMTFFIQRSLLNHICHTDTPIQLTSITFNCINHAGGFLGKDSNTRTHLNTFFCIEQEHV